MVPRESEAGEALGKAVLAMPAVPEVLGNRRNYLTVRRSQVDATRVFGHQEWSPARLRNNNIQLMISSSMPNRKCADT